MVWFLGLGLLFVVLVVALMFLIAMTTKSFELESPYMSAKDLWVGNNRDQDIDG